MHVDVGVLKENWPTRRQGGALDLPLLELSFLLPKFKFLTFSNFQLVLYCPKAKPLEACSVF